MAKRFQVCVLVSHTQKKQEHTDPRHLDQANTLILNPEMLEAVKRTFPEV
jgi:hypothetical protein